MNVPWFKSSNSRYRTTYWTTLSIIRFIFCYLKFESFHNGCTAQNSDQATSFKSVINMYLLFCAIYYFHTISVVLYNFVIKHLKVYYLVFKILYRVSTLNGVQWLIHKPIRHRNIVPFKKYFKWGKKKIFKICLNK